MNHENDVTQAETQTPVSQTVSLLVFNVAGQAYGLFVTQVVGIIEMVTITRLPAAPKAIEGIINLRGKSVPVLDLRRRFALPLKAYGVHTPIILVEVGHHTLGFIVDEVNEVLKVNFEQVEPIETILPPELTSQLEEQIAYLTSVVKVEQRLILLLNVNTVLSVVDSSYMDQTVTHTVTVGAEL